MGQTIEISLLDQRRPQETSESHTEKSSSLLVSEHQLWPCRYRDVCFVQKTWEMILCSTFH